MQIACKLYAQTVLSIYLYTSISPKFVCFKVVFSACVIPYASTQHYMYCADTSVMRCRNVVRHVGT